MAAAPCKHKHRHFKTLILLVVSMTSGAFLLFWVDQHTPTHRPRTLRGMVPNSGWTDVAVRTVSAADAHGFFHFRIAADGQWYQSSAWTQGRRDPKAESTIHVVLTKAAGASRVSDAQQSALRLLVEQLRRQYQIAPDHVRPVTQAVLVRSDA